jgi:hypothetical protein
MTPPTPSEAAGSTLDSGMRTSIEGALEVVRKHDPGRHGLIHNLCRLAAWLDGHPERDDEIRSYYPGFETVIGTKELERMRERLAEQEAQLAAAKPALALVEHAKGLVREIPA